MKHCPSCKYTEALFKEDEKKWGGKGFSSWVNYKPIVYRDRLSGNWVIECQNCGMAILFGADSKDKNIELWNRLPRS